MYAGEYLDAINALDPKFRDPYVNADLVLTFQAIPTHGLVRITLERALNDGTFAIDLDPLSLLSRRHAAEACLAASVPAEGFTAPSGAPASNAGRGPSRTPSTS